MTDEEIIAQGKQDAKIKQEYEIWQAYERFKNRLTRNRRDWIDDYEQKIGLYCQHAGI